MKVKRFSKVKESDDPTYKLRLYFKFDANEDPSSDLHDVGLLVCHSIRDVRGNEPHHEGEAYTLTDSREDLEKAQERLRQLGWEEIPDA